MPATHGEVRWALVLLVAIAVIRSAEAEDLRGRWRGTYQCFQGPTAVTVDVGPGNQNPLPATFTFFP